MASKKQMKQIRKDISLEAEALSKMVRDWVEPDGIDDWTVAEDLRCLAINLKAIADRADRADPPDTPKYDLGEVQVYLTSMTRSEAHHRLEVVGEPMNEMEIRAYVLAKVRIALQEDQRLLVR